MDVDQYLKRINVDRIEQLNLDFLARLQTSHMVNVPFENLDVMNQIPITLEINSLFSKIVTQERGGFCFELNGAMNELLLNLGFEVKMTEAAVYDAVRQEFGDIRNHMTLIVNLDQLYLVDVGFGDGPRNPLPLSGGPVSDPSGTYQIRQQDSEFYILEKHIDTELIPFYKFNLNDLKLEDYQENCDWIQSSTESNFTQGKIWTIALPEGRITLSEQNVTITKLMEKTLIEFTREKDFEFYLKSYLGDGIQ